MMAESAKKRKVYSSAEKLKIVKVHLIGKKPVSTLCVQYGIVPSLFYKWQQALFEHGGTAFEKKRGLISAGNHAAFSI